MRGKGRGAGRGGVFSGQPQDGSKCQSGTIYTYNNKMLLINKYVYIQMYISLSEWDCCDKW